MDQPQESAEAETAVAEVPVPEEIPSDSGPSGDAAPEASAPNRRYAAPPNGLLGRFERWGFRLVGQVRRQYLSRLRPGYVAKARAERRGECRCCGNCCDLTFHCPYLTDEQSCREYEKRQITCRDFPHDALDLRLTQVPCGHWFDGQVGRDEVRIPLSGYGRREIALFGGGAAAGIVLSALWFWYTIPLFAAILAFVLYFFRDPPRRTPQDPRAVIAPADGRVVEVSEVDEAPLMGGRAHKVAIFMSPLNVHVNRAPAAGAVERVEHRPGRFHNASRPEASAENESASLVLAGVDGGRTRIVVRQVSGALARRIVCAARKGDRLDAGQRFGMIKIGSRAEVYVPADAGFQVAVEIGRRVRAGETVLGVFES